MSKHFKRHFNFPSIKKTGRTQIHHDDDRATITSSTTIKPKKGNNHKKKSEKIEH